MGDGWVDVGRGKYKKRRCDVRAREGKKVRNKGA